MISAPDISRVTPRVTPAPAAGLPEQSNSPTILSSPVTIQRSHRRRSSPSSRFQTSVESEPSGPLSSRHVAGLILDDLPELHITKEEDASLESLIAEASGESSIATGIDKSAERSKAPRIVLPVEWVVDIADKDNDWFVATAYTYNDVEQTVHIMVPDSANPTWEGDVSLNPLVLRLLECCDGRSMALFKQVIRHSALEVDWSVRIHRNHPAVRELAEVHHKVSALDDKPIISRIARHDSAPNSETVEEQAPVIVTPPLPLTPREATPALPPEPGVASAECAPFVVARATILLPLGSYVVVELGPNDVHCCVGREGSRSSSGLRVTAEDGWGSGGGQGAGDGGNRVKRRVAQLDDRLELVECRGVGGVGEEAFYRLAEEGVVAHDTDTAAWRSFKERQERARQERHERHKADLSLAKKKTQGASGDKDYCNSPTGDFDPMARPSSPRYRSSISALRESLERENESMEIADKMTPAEAILREVRKATRILADRSMDIHDGLLREHVMSLRRLRRFVLDGNLDDGAVLMDQAIEAHRGVLQERHASDRERLSSDAAALEAVLVILADRLQIHPKSTPNPRKSETVAEVKMGVAIGNEEHTDQGENEEVRGVDDGTD